MIYQWYSAKIILTIIFIAGFSHSAHCANVEPYTDISRLVELIKIEDKQKPLHVFHDFDQKVHRAALDHFNNHPDLIQGIKTDLGAKSLQWQLADLEYRVLFVPEKRSEYAALYESYCQDVINDLLAMTKLENPFNDINTLTGKKPDIAEGHGVYAFLVHNLVKEFSGTSIV